MTRLEGSPDGRAPPQGARPGSPEDSRWPPSPAATLCVTNPSPTSAPGLTGGAIRNAAVWDRWCAGRGWLVSGLPPQSPPRVPRRPVPASPTHGRPPRPAASGWRGTGPSLPFPALTHFLMLLPLPGAAACRHCPAGSSQVLVSLAALFRLRGAGWDRGAASRAALWAGWEPPGSPCSISSRPAPLLRHAIPP